jgi:disulfide bond formation protein DsbB
VNVLAVTTFLAVLALAAAAGTLGILVWASASRFAAGPARALRATRAGLRPLVLWLTFALALVATLGSLYLSEVARFVPCTLCWYQRIAMYPLALLLGIAAVRGDLAVRRYAVPLAGIGSVIAAYHVALQRLPGLPSGTCSLDVPCSAIYVERFGFVTIPVMALIGFVAIVVTLTVLGPKET